ncbi:MAG: uncharacterized protein A8A55_1622 [Amphiamblys sp. WSBS2006]|nr:MAG: uncharacterized protein A8A55_1622 [Amphiamblys sp. WSBS2006]
MAPDEKVLADAVETVKTHIESFLIRNFAEKCRSESLVLQKHIRFYLKHKETQLILECLQTFDSKPPKGTHQADAVRKAKETRRRESDAHRRLVERITLKNTVENSKYIFCRIRYCTLKQQKKTDGEKESKEKTVPESGKRVRWCENLLKEKQDQPADSAPCIENTHKAPPIVPPVRKEVVRVRKLPRQGRRW